MHPVDRNSKCVLSHDIKHLTALVEEDFIIICFSCRRRHRRIRRRYRLELIDDFAPQPLLDLIMTTFKCIGFWFTTAGLAQNPTTKKDEDVRSLNQSESRPQKEDSEEVPSQAKDAARFCRNIDKKHTISCSR